MAATLLINHYGHIGFMAYWGVVVAVLVVRARLGAGM